MPPVAATALLPASHEDPRDVRRARLEAVAMAGLVSLVVGIAVAGAWFNTTTMVRENYRSHLLTLARVAAQQVDASLHGLLRHPEQMDGPLYRRAVDPLRRLRLQIPEIRYLYTIVRDGKDVRIILDSADPGDLDHDGVEDRSSIWDVSHSPQTAKYVALGWNGQPQPAATNEPYHDAWGTWMSGYAPFFDSAGRLAGAAGVDIDASAYVGQLEHARRQALLGLLPAGLLVIALTWGTFRLRLRHISATRLANDGARRDRLTRLANRTAFMECLGISIGRVRSGAQPRFAMLFLDFDHFKLVNDTLGHEAGDELLRQISVRLRAALGVEDAVADRGGRVVARFGGDEFVVLANDVPSEGAARALAARLLESLAPPYEIKGSDVHSSASIGVVVGGMDVEDADTVVRFADVAMYAAKRGGRNCYVLFDDAMRATLTRRVTIERSLLKAIGTSQLPLCYQPIVELDTGRMVSAEALLRWEHPTLGGIPPGEVLPIAEESGLIVPLSEWIMREACMQLAAWLRESPARAPDYVSVNVARADLALGSRLRDRVRRALAEAQLAPHRLQLELSERELGRDASATASLLQSLREIGVRLSLDEFGSSTTSLSSLRGYAVDSVKVARSFVKGMASNGDVLAVIHAALTLVENLGMSSIAEGIEDAAQLAILQSLGCRFAQGRWLGEPMPGDALLESWDAGHPNIQLRGVGANAG
jgi:diguanylate cyclase (GGDEF)-like protein